MSARLLGLGFGCDMGTTYRKLVLLKLIDACDDDGARIFPAVATIARAAQCSTRQVQRELALFVRVGLLRVVQEGGKGRGSTREYALNVDLLRLIEAEGWDAATAAGADAVGADAAVSDAADDAAGDAPGGADTAKGDRESPLRTAPKGDSGDTFRVTGATSKGDKLSHPTPYDPSRDPSKRERARPGDTGGQDKGGTQDKGGVHDDGRSAAGQTVADFRAAYPASGQDDQDAIDRAWLALTPGERQRALDRLPAFLAERRAQRPKLGRLFAQIYLSQKRFDQVHDAAPDGRRATGHKVVLDHHSRVWWAYLLALLDSGEIRKARLVSDLAKGGSGWAVAPGQVPAPEAVAALVKVASTSPEWQAWSAWFRARGIHFPHWSKQQWCWLPARRPDLVHDPGAPDPAVELARASGL